MKKTNFNFRHSSKQSITLLALILLGLGIAPQAWAYKINNAKVYYDPTAAGWGSGDCKFIQIFIDKGTDDWGNSGMSMSKITNTNLWFWTGSWGDDNVSHLRFATTKSGDWGWYSKQSSWDRLNNNSNCCGVDNGANTDVNNQHKLFTSTGTSKGASINETTLSGYSDLNKQQTVKVMISTDGGTSYSEATSDWYSNTINANRYTMTADNKAENSQKEVKRTENYASGVITSSITFTANASSNFTFKGWSDSNSGPDSKKTDAAYTYTVSGTKTIYAYFQEKMNTINLVGCTATSTTAGPITTGTATAKEPAGMQFSTFTKSSEAISWTTSESASPVSFNATAEGTITAQFTYKTPTIEVASTATYTLGGAAIKLNPVYSNLAEGATYSWTCTSVTPSGESGATISDCKFSANNIANPNISADKAGTYTITVTATNGTGEGSKTSDVKTITLTAQPFSGNDCGTCFNYQQ